MLTLAMGRLRDRTRWMRRLQPAVVAAPVSVEVVHAPASPSVESVFQATVARGARVIGVVGVAGGVGASTLARSLAGRCVAGRRRTLLVDASRDVASGPKPLKPARDRDTPDRVTLCPSGEDVFAIRTPGALRRMLDESYGEYETVIVDCAPAIERPDDAIPGRFSAASVDAAIIVCLGGKVTSDDLNGAKAALGGAPVAGVVVNGRDQPTLGAEIAREARRFSRYLPLVARRIAQRAENSRFLDVRT